MPIFTYKGMDAAGKKTSGTVDAENVKAARAKLRKLNVFPTDVNEGAPSQIGSGRGGFLKGLQKVKTRDLANMTRQLSTLVSANIPLVDSLGAMVDQVENPLLKDAMSAIR